MKTETRGKWLDNRGHTSEYCFSPPDAPAVRPLQQSRNFGPVSGVRFKRGGVSKPLDVPLDDISSCERHPEGPGRTERVALYGIKNHASPAMRRGGDRRNMKEEKTFGDPSGGTQGADLRRN